MSLADRHSPLWTIEPVALAQLTASAELQTRVDRKYVLPRRAVAGLLAEIAADARVLEIDGQREFGYESVYFDTPELLSYRLTALRRRRRFKIRTRTYLDSAQCWLEVKTEGSRGSTVKERLPYAMTDHAELAPGRWFVDGILARLAVPAWAGLSFEPTLVTRYRRSTLLLPATRSRVTIDTQLMWQAGDAGQLSLPRLVVVETKTGSTPSPVDRLLWARQYRPVKISKYATGLAALRPELPAVPWRSTLRRHFTVRDQPVSHAVVVTPIRRSVAA
jgi:hypothetical protein